jgi:hypothetical protein
MSHTITRALHVAGLAALLAAAPATALAGDADATNPGKATALAALSRSPEAAPDAVTAQVAAILKTRHETAKNAIGNIR